MPGGGTEVLGDELTAKRLAAMMALALIVGVPLGVQAGKVYVQETAPPAPTPEDADPTTPVNQRPDDGATGVPRTPLFTWAPAQDESAVTYALVYSPDPTFEVDRASITAFGMREPRYGIQEKYKLEPATTYYWRVIAVDQWSNPSEWSEVTRFTTGAGSPGR